MSSRDFALYTNLYDSVAPLFPVPHLILYLQAECDWLQLRIARRGRIGEEAALTSLLVRTNELYEIWLSTFTLCPVLRYNAAALDCLHNAAHLTSIVHDVCSALDWHLPGDYVPTTE